MLKNYERLFTHLSPGVSAPIPINHILVSLKFLTHRIIERIFLSNFFTWGSVCFAHIRFRKAWAAAGRTTDDLPFAAMFGTTGSWIGLALNILCLIAQFYVALWPIGGKPDAEAFFESYLAAPIVIAFFVGYKLYYRQWSIGVKLADIDVDAGRREVDFVAFRAELDAEKAERQSWPAWKRYWNFWF